jgi:hypothetical protein
VYTRNTAGTGCGMPRCAKIHYRTRTHVTRFGNTAGLPAPVLNLMPGRPHTMPESDKYVQIWVEQVFGFRPCLWQICIVSAILDGNDVITILDGNDVITIAPTGSGKSLTYWMPPLFIKYGITVVVTPLKLLRGQFLKMLQDKNILGMTYIHFCLLRNPMLAAPTAVPGAQPCFASRSFTGYIAAHWRF